MKSNQVNLILAACAALSLIACADHYDGNDSQNSDPVIPTPTEVPVIVHNFTGISISGLFLSPSASSRWGSNQLDVPLLSGNTLTLSGVPCDRDYDLKATAGSLVVVEVQEVYIECGPGTEVTLN